MAEVIVYTTQSCPWCQRVKEYLREHSIDFTEVDVSSNYQAAMEMVSRSGQQGVPQLLINGEVVVGFDKPHIDQLLGIG